MVIGSSTEVDRLLSETAEVVMQQGLRSARAPVSGFLRDQVQPLVSDKIKDRERSGGETR